MAIIVQNVSDTLTFNDDAPRPPRGRTATDTVNFIDSATAKQNPTRYFVSDNLIFSDSAQVVGKRTWYPSLAADNLVFTESAIVHSTPIRLSVAETFTMNDVAVVKNLTQRVSESIIFSETARSGIIFAAVFDSLTFTDSATAKSPRYSVNDAIVFSDSAISRYSIRNIKVADTLVFTEKLVVKQSLYHLVDVMVFNDAVGFSYTRSVNDNIIFIDSADWYKAADLQSLKDTLVFADSAGWEKSRPSGDALQFAEAVCVCMVRVRPVTDTIVFSDFATVSFANPTDPRNSTGPTLYPQNGFNFSAVFKRSVYDKLVFVEKIQVLKNNIEYVPPNCCD